jgi:hypothetical protein
MLKRFFWRCARPASAANCRRRRTRRSASSSPRGSSRSRSTPDGRPVGGAEVVANVAANHRLQLTTLPARGSMGVLPPREEQEIEIGTYLLLLSATLWLVGLLAMALAEAGSRMAERALPAIGWACQSPGSAGSGCTPRSG